VPAQDVRVEFVALPAARAAPAVTTTHTTPRGGSPVVVETEAARRIRVVLPAVFSLRPLLEAFGVALDDGDVTAAAPEAFEVGVRRWTV
jgi:hypothetical protein